MQAPPFENRFHSGRHLFAALIPCWVLVSQVSWFVFGWLVTLTYIIGSFCLSLRLPYF
jgi:hypothetical protein